MSNTQVSRITQIGIYLGKHWRLFINERGWKVLIFGCGLFWFLFHVVLFFVGLFR